MSDRSNRKVTYLTDSEAAQLSEWADSVEKSESALLREAVLEYLDHDRTARIEEKVDTALSILRENQHTHTSDSNQSVPEKARAIARRVQQNHDTPVPEKDIEIAIEDIAGGDERTLEQYKTQFKKRELLFEHPKQPVWTDDRQEFVSWIERSKVEQHEATDGYGMTTDEYNEVAEAIQ